MPNWTKIPALLVAGMLLAGGVGCGGDEETTTEQSPGPDAETADEGGGDPVELDQFGERLVDRSCTDYFDCCDESERNALAGDSFETRQECRSALESMLNQFENRLRTAVEAGRVEYDSQAAGQCFSAASSGRCDDFPNPDSRTPLAGLSGDSCENWFQPEVQLGGTCRMSLACKEGFCWIPVDAEEGTCRKRPAAGEDCASCTKTDKGDRHCQIYSCRSDGYRCQTADDGDPDTVEHVCQAVKEQGESCTGDSDCETRICGDDGTCRPKKTAGKRCDWSGVCESGACNDPNPDDGNRGTCLAGPICDGAG